jgi:hypothetical protein
LSRCLGADVGGGRGLEGRPGTGCVDNWDGDGEEREEDGWVDHFANVLLCRFGSGGNWIVEDNGLPNRKAESESLKTSTKKHIEYQFLFRPMAPHVGAFTIPLYKTSISKVLCDLTLTSLQP